MAQLAFEDLVAEMAGNETTNDHDVLVAYSEAKINELLRNYSDSAQKELSLGPFTMQIYDERNDEDYKKTLLMQVKPPVLRFEGTEDVILNYDVAGGTTQIEDEEEKPLPVGLYLQLKAKLGNVSGTVDSANEFNADENGEARRAKYKVVLNPAREQAAQCVFIDMKNVIASVKPKPESSELAERAARSLDSACRQIQAYFQGASETRYYLGGVSNTYASDKDAHVLRPVSFTFSIAGAGTEEAALCMWIGVSGGGQNGTHQAGPAPVDFHPGKYSRNPVPVGSTASIILSHDIIWRQFLKPNLDKIFLEVSASPHTETDAFKAKGQLNAAQYKKDGYSKEDVFIAFSSHRDAISFSPKNPESNVSIHRGIAKPSTVAATISYQSSEQEVGWGWRKGSDVDQRQGAISESGTTYLTYAWGAKGYWKSSTEGRHPNSISLDWEGDRHWTIMPRVQERDDLEKLWQAIGGRLTTDRLPAELVEQNVPAPTVNLHMDSLDYFLTTNLLCPGKHTFKAHSIGTDESKGLAVPHDLILTGDIDTSIPQ